MNLTNDQYDALYLATINLMSAIHEGREYDVYAIHLSACVAILTGHYPEKNVIEMAEASDRNRESVEAIIRRLIGDFTYAPEYWQKRSISMAEVEALGGI